MRLVFSVGYFLFFDLFGISWGFYEGQEGGG